MLTLPKAIFDSLQRQSAVRDCQLQRERKWTDAERFFKEPDR